VTLRDAGGSAKRQAAWRARRKELLDQQAEQIRDLTARVRELEADKPPDHAPAPAHIAAVEMSALDHGAYWGGHSITSSRVVAAFLRRRRGRR
jgi:hypothetical protein